MRFLGTYRPKLDEKGRLFLPAKFRDRLAEGVVLTQGMENCLFVWPTETFDRYSDDADTGVDSASSRGYTRVFFSGADEQVPDKQGRIVVAAGLRAYARLDREVVVIGVKDRLEIWNAEAWDTYSARQEQLYSARDEPRSAPRPAAQGAAP